MVLWPALLLIAMALRASARTLRTEPVARRPHPCTARARDVLGPDQHSAARVRRT
jgi:hypothetical protein